MSKSIISELPQEKLLELAEHMFCWIKANGKQLQSEYGEKICVDCGISPCADHCYRNELEGEFQL